MRTNNQEREIADFKNGKKNLLSLTSLETECSQGLLPIICFSGLCLTLLTKTALTESLSKV